MLIRRHRQQTDIWPGFVDSLSALIMVIIFLLMIFVVAQFFLGETLSGRNREVGILNQELSKLAEILALEERKTESLSNQLTNLQQELTASLNENKNLKTTLETTQQALQATTSELDEMTKSFLALEANVRALEAKRDDLINDIASRDQRLEEAERQQIKDQAELSLLNQQMQALREQLGRLEQLLSEAEQRNKEANAQIVDLGKRLNVALATKVSELAQYRSEFFGKLREILGKREDIKIVGDRFVFQSEVLFDQGAAELGVEGQLQLARLSKTLKEITDSIPADLKWILQVEGHTDTIPIQTTAFPSNWELSLARALSVVRFLIGQGIAPERLSAAGFGEFQPLNPADTPTAHRQNRRIELKLTDRAEADKRE